MEGDITRVGNELVATLLIIETVPTRHLKRKKKMYWGGADLPRLEKQKVVRSMMKLRAIIS